MKNTVNTLKATAYKEGKWWMVSIPEIEGLTQAKNIAQIPEQAADLAAVILDVPAEQVAITISYKLPEDAAAADQAWKAAQQQLAAAKANVDATLADLVRTLKGQGYTLKDIGALTGYTFQRVAQIINS